MTIDALLCQVPMVQGTYLLVPEANRRQQVRVSRVSRVSGPELAGKRHDDVIHQVPEALSPKLEPEPGTVGAAINLH